MYVLGAELIGFQLSLLFNCTVGLWLLQATVNAVNVGLTVC